MQRQPISVLLLTGPTGVGKTVVADTIYEMFAGQNESIALINLDELGYVSPQSPDDPYNAQLRLKNLTAVWPNYVTAGARRVIIPYVIESTAAIERLRLALPGSNLTIIQLTAPLDTITKRIKHRDLGGSTRWHINRAAELIRVFADAKLTPNTVDTSHKSIDEVARAVLEQWTIKHVEAV